MGSPKVSILIPCYNAEKFLAQTIRSAIDQRWPDKEIIVVDDGSADNSLSIAKSFESEMVKVYSQQNAGACRARNFAFEKSTGDFIQYLDADDLLHPDKIWHQVRSIQPHGSHQLASSRWARFFNEPGEAVFQHLSIYKNYNQPVDMLQDMWTNFEMMQTSVWLVPRQIVEKAGKWDESLSINQDGEFFCRALLVSTGVIFCPESKSFYRSGNMQSISNAKPSEKKAASLLKSYQSCERELTRHTDDPRIFRALANLYYSFIYQYYHLFPKLVAIAKEKVDGWRVPPPGSLGGQNFKRMSRILGFYKTLQLRKFISRSRQPLSA